MVRNEILNYLGSKFPTRKSLAGNLQLLTGVVFIVLTIIFVTGYSYVSSKFAHDERMDSARALGSTLSRLVARPVSMGDYLSVEQSLQGSSLQDFICSIHVITPNGIAVASINNRKSTLCSDKGESLSTRFSIMTVGALDPAGEREVGSVVLKIGLSDLDTARLRNILTAFMLGGGLMVVLLILNWIAVDWALQPLARAVQAALAPTSGANRDSDRTKQALKAAPREIQPLLETLIKLSADYAKADGDIRVAKVARQVAHDIRSPLAALEMGSASQNIPEAERVIIRQATTRIRDIANDLSGRFRESPVEVHDSDATAQSDPQLIPILIDEIVTEMRLRYRSRRNLEITANLDESNYGLFALVDPASFRRALSNIIQNAVEAVRDDGKIEIRSEVSDGNAVIKVIDNGQGIPADILPRLGERGETYGKTNGSGLGLHYAKQMLEHWNGTLNIESKLGAGTTVSMILPVAREPDWFVPRIEVSHGCQVAVLDDDQSIHQIWNERLSELVESKSIDIIHFTSGADFRAWFKENEALARRAKYLVDFELIGEKDTGFSLIEELGIQENSILITSHYDEIAVRAACQKSRVRLIPKGLAAFVPIRLEDRNVSAVLVDDDMLTHQIWNHVAKQANRRVITAISDNELDCDALSSDTPIYVDRNLGEATRGEDVLKRLHLKGFTHLFLYTGDELTPNDLRELEFIRGVVGKDIPAEVYWRT